MAEVSNKTLALLVLAALGVTLISVGVQMSETRTLTGQATSATGIVNLSIQSSVSIAVDATNATVDFGTCTPNGSNTNISSNTTSDLTGELCNGSAVNGDEHDSSYIRIDNVGSLEANISLAGECAATALIPETSGTDAAFYVSFNGSPAATDCGNWAVAGWNSLGTSNITACHNLTIGNSFLTFAQITLPGDADGGTTPTCNTIAPANANTLTYVAEQA